jgi:hypothetical protein
MNHFKPVPLTEHSLTPTRPRHNLPIVLNRHAVTLQPQLANQHLKAHRRPKRFEHSGLTIQNYRKRHVASLAGNPAAPRTQQQDLPVIRRSRNSLLIKFPAL